jgi:adenylosuccinate synthase
VSTGVGLAPGNLKKIIGVAKAYCTRVGGGPFPTELTNLTGDQIRKKGNEFGTTTGRPRRVGWMDLNMMRTSCRLNGYTELAITKLDVLAGMDSLMVAESYTYKGEEILEFPSSLKVIEKCKPNYIEVEGFGSLEGVNNYKKLPKEARKYIELIESETETTVKMVSIGPEREQTLIK